jgi:opacity protein-like surface antigen
MKCFPLVLILLFAALSARAQETPKVEVFGGYSYLRGDLGDISVNSHGWNGSVTYNFDSILGIKADFSGHAGNKTFTTQIPAPIPIVGDPFVTTSFDLRPRDFTFLFGPQVTYRKKKTVIPFGHVLLGGVNRKVRIPLNATQIVNPGTTTTTVSFVTGSDTGFGAAFGGGLDLRVSKRVALRAFQVDYLLSRVSIGTQHNLRLSTGLVLRFGM